MVDPLSRAPSLRDQPVEYLHDGLVSSLLDLPVSETRSPGEFLNSLENNTRMGGLLLTLATDGRQNTQLSQRNKQISENLQDLIRDYPTSNVETERLEYVPKSAHTQTGNQI